MEQRRVAAVLGCLVADSAAQPMHWVYNADTLKQITDEKEEVEFRDPSVNPFYRIPCGRQSCYGDQAILILRSLVACKGYNKEDLTARMYKHFGPGSEYDVKDTSIKPRQGPWIQGSLKHFVKEYAAKQSTGDPNDQQVDSCAKLVAVVALYAGSNKLLPVAEDIIRLTQDSDIPVAMGLAYARLLEHYILHGRDSNALDAVVASLLDPKRHHPHDLDRHIANQIKDVQNRREQPVVANSPYKIS